MLKTGVGGAACLSLAGAWDYGGAPDYMLPRLLK